MSSQDIEDYHSLILNQVPLMDVRAPVEFEAGHLPTSHNYPLLDNNEREAIGTCYKEEGRDQAIELGYKLVSGDNRANKIQAWQDFYCAHPAAVIYCARGGMRSKLTQSWLVELGVDCQRVHLGYKGLRHYLLSVLEKAAQHPMLVVSGDTGTGKTELLQDFGASIDLEGLANHHGSAFGKNIAPQPAQATFENALAMDCVIKDHHPVWLVEDESRNIGKTYLPEAFHQMMKQAPLVIIEEPLESRLQRIAKLYFQEKADQYQQVYGEEQGWHLYREYLLAGLFCVQKRLGLPRFNTLNELLLMALDQQEKTADIDLHFAWLTPLLTEYYDPMYEYQLEKKKERVLHRGTYQSVYEFIQSMAIDKII